MTYGREQQKMPKPRVALVSTVLRCSPACTDFPALPSCVFTCSCRGSAGILSLRSGCSQTLCPGRGGLGVAPVPT